MPACLTKYSKPVHRLKKRKDFLQVQRSKKRSFGRFVTVAIRYDLPENHGRFGITISKKVGQAHLRNKIKRRIRHIFRDNPHLFLTKSLVVIVKNQASVATFSDLSSDLIKACLQKPKFNNFKHKNKAQNTAGERL